MPKKPKNARKKSVRKASSRDKPDLGRLNHAVREVWNRNADFWDEQMGEGNVFHKSLIEPAQLRLLNITGSEVVLDAACGNGQFSRKMADLGAQIIAIDASDRMIANARKRSAGFENRIEYGVIDCTSKKNCRRSASDGSIMWSAQWR